ncbi:MAG: hypothetical protein IH582_19365 [Afipia sp.]|nr:hypothetical protein [Afipia sp.]
MPDGKTAFFMHDSRNGRGMLNLTAGLEEQGAREYASRYAALNPWVLAAAAHPVGEGVIDHNLVPRGTSPKIRVL